MGLDLRDNPNTYTNLVRILELLLRLEIITREERVWTIRGMFELE